eukprot:Tbor_TRINITY_DN4857_c0_g2::TRINITY_DN4857_c0_g2_i2::g.1365::m.1365/K01304/pcp; pyroglutamyl-peptidase
METSPHTNEHISPQSHITNSDHTSLNSDTVILSSFGPFLNVVDNPSRTVASAVMKELQQRVKEKRTTRSNFHIRHDESLEVSASGVVQYFASLQSEIKEYYYDNALGESNGRRRHWLIHFGVHRSGNNINIELTGHNCATFTDGDATGYKCSNKPIICNKEASPLDPGYFIEQQEGLKEQWKMTLSNLKSVPLENISNPTQITISSQVSEPWAIRQCEDISNNHSKEEVSRNNMGNNNNNVRLCVSHDAGRYVCNLTLFLSLLVSHTANLREALSAANSIRGPSVISLFIHVVREEYMSAEEQASLISQFLLHLIEDDEAVQVSHLTV